ncbi:hypothetical protein ARMGADRAFT_429155 [Armillaria gallica]|uniref:Uncharacterized protein n=1 Tax=Armillaria gallica TaxID=47427 RepID=A0A2H3D2J3_ARMGA|nr:hypothetical protein ARMGADRAFT_429155 [Armillaria gallica]
MARSQLWTHTALLHPSSPLASPCTCLPSHRPTPDHLPPQVRLFHRTLWLSFCHLYASRLFGVVRAIRKATIRTNLANSGGAFSIIAASIAYYFSLAELLVSEAKAVTVLPVRAFYFFDFIRPPFVVHLSHHQIITYHGVSSIPRVLNSNHRSQ